MPTEKQPPSSLPNLITAGLLLFALTSNPASFYTMLRVVVLVAALYDGYILLQNRQKLLVWISAIILILFNPFIPIPFSRMMWLILNPVTAVFFIWLFLQSARQNK